MRFWLATAFLPASEQLALARAADAAGYHGVTVSDHIAWPRHLRSRYPYSPHPDGSPVWAPETDWPDPWVLVSAMAAVTTRLQFTTNVYVAPARDLFTVAKLVSTAAVLSGDRVALGVAAGWCREEFALTGQDFATRGRRLDEMIVALRAVWKGGWAEHHGRFVDFDAVQISPVPSAPIPIYVGGHSDAALRRAATLGDGWIGFSAWAPEQAHAELDRLERHLADAGRRLDGSFEVIIALLAPPDPDLYEELAARGVTGLLVAPWMAARDGDLADRVSAVERFAERVVVPRG